MNAPQFIIECYPHGLIIKTPPGQIGIPLSALEEITKIAPDDAFLDGGLAGALHVPFVIGSKEQLDEWRKEHEASIVHYPPAERWLRGCDVGISSLTIFVALIDNIGLRTMAECYYPGREFTPDTPRDSADFGRCHRLLQLTPAWEAQLPRVAEAFPQSNWGKIIPIWPQLKAAYEAKDFKTVSELLNKANE